MQRLHNLEKWSRLDEGKAANFDVANLRRVRIDFNAPFPVRLYVSDSEGVSTFLALVHGKDVVEFAIEGEFAITTEGGPVWMHTVEGEDFSFSIPDAETFTKLIERRARNPEVEMMKYAMEANMKAMLDAQRADLERLLDRRAAAAAAVAAKSPPESDGGAAGAKSQPDKSAASAEKPDKADGGDGTKAAG